MDNFDLKKYLYNNTLLVENEGQGLNEGILDKVIDKVKSVIQRNINKLDSGVIDDIKDKVQKALGKSIDQLDRSDLTLDNAKKVAAEFGLNEDEKLDEGTLHDKYPKFFNALGLGGLVASIAGRVAGPFADSPMFLIGIAALIVAFISTFEMDESVEEMSSKMKKSELKEKIKAEITNTLQEQDDDVDGDFGDEAPEAPAEDAPDLDGDGEPDYSDEAGLNDEETEIQNALKTAYDNAVSLGDQKLANQISNTITFFTRAHVAPNAGE